MWSSRESVGRRIEVVLAAAHQCAQPFRRPARPDGNAPRPRPTSGPGHPDQHHQRRIGQRHRRPWFARTHSQLGRPAYHLERRRDLLEARDEQLKAASVDRFRKYTSVHGIYDGPIPAAIVYPSSTQDVAAILRFAAENLVNLVPRTGQTATEGGLETVVEDSLVVDGSRMNAILSIDPVDMMATTQCGVGLQELEDTLRAQGLTTGHSPQSKPLAQMGGLVATRSIGQFSTLYGGIEDMVVGLESVFPGGTVTRIKNVPRRAAGPDIRHVVIGSEGALCFITEVTVKLFRYQPENNRYFGFLVDTFADGIAAIRELITAGYRPSVCRVYSPEDARQHFAGFYQGKNVVVLVAEGPKGIADATAKAIEELFAGRRARARRRRPDPAVVREPQLGPGQDRRREGRHALPRPPRIHHRDIRQLVTRQRVVRRRHEPDPQRVPAGR